MDTLDALIDPMRAAEQLQALREQRRLLGDLIDDVSLARRGLQLRLTATEGVGATAGAWCSPASNAYAQRAEEMIGRLDCVVDELQAALEAVHGAIARLTMNGL